MNMAEFRKAAGRPTNRPSEQELVKLYEEHSASQIAKMYGVTESAVRRWIQYYRNLHKRKTGETV